MFRSDMKLNNVLNKILQSKNIKISQKDYSINFFEKNLIDSIQFLDLISEIEKLYKVKFSNKDFNSQNVYTIKSLNNLLIKKINAKKK